MIMDKKTSYLDIAGISCATSFPLLANTGGTSIFEIERSKTKREGMEIAFSATASWLTANYDDRQKVWRSFSVFMVTTVFHCLSFVFVQD
jgi:hypothetical protein